MSWNGHIPCNPRRVKGLRNKRSKKSPKAIAARLANMAKQARKPDRHSSDSGAPSWGFIQ